MEQSERPLALTGLLEIAGHALGIGLDETSPFEESFEVVFREGQPVRVHLRKAMKLTLGQFDIPLPRHVLATLGR